MISNNNQNQIKSTNNTISNKQSTATETPYEIEDLSSVQSFFDCNAIDSGTIYLTLYDNDDGTHTASFECINSSSWEQTLSGTNLNLTIPSIYTPPGSSTTYTITAIGDSAFWDCTNLQSVTFEDGSQLKSIGNYTFYGCTSLNSINIPNNVSSIGE